MNTFYATYISDFFTLNNTIFHVKIKRGDFHSSAPFIIRNLKLNNYSKFIIECEDCVCWRAQSAFWIFDNNVDETSIIEIRGKYTCGEGAPVINTRNDIVLNNCTLIVGNVNDYAVTTDVAPKVVCKDAYTNSMQQDGNVTELVDPLFRDPEVK